MMDTNEKAKLADVLIDQIKPVLAGYTIGIQGAVIAQLAAIFLASHNPAIRRRSREMLIELMDDLVPIIIGEMIAKGSAPAGWDQTI